MESFDTSICQAVCRLLDQAETFVLATILRHSGSTPRTSGSKMLVCRDGSIIGTIGGGRVEAEVIKTALGLFTGGAYRISSFDLTSANTVDTMDMICGGRMDVLLEVIAPTALNHELFLNQRAGMIRGEKNLMVVALPSESGKDAPIARCLVSADGSVIGTCDIEDEILIAIWQRVGDSRTPSVLTVAGGTYLAEPVYSAETVFLFGAGHVSREVALLTTRVGFRTVVFDDREEYANPRRFGFVDDIRVSPAYTNVFSGLEINSDVYVVIVTRGHRYDKTVLAQALRTQAGYIGMIGSRIKRNLIYKELLAEGFSETDLKRVFSPIGIDIGAETPEEIALSIVSELVKERAKKMGRLKIGA